MKRVRDVVDRVRFLNCCYLFKQRRYVMTRREGGLNTSDRTYHIISACCGAIDSFNLPTEIVKTKIAILYGERKNRGMHLR